jgi:hypothetical protein
MRIWALETQEIERHSEFERSGKACNVVRKLGLIMAAVMGAFLAYVSVLMKLVTTDRILELGHE